VKAAPAPAGRSLSAARLSPSLSLTCIAPAAASATRLPSALAASASSAQCFADVVAGAIVGCAADAVDAVAAAVVVVAGCSRHSSCRESYGSRALKRNQINQQKSYPGRTVRSKDNSKRTSLRISVCISM